MRNENSRDTESFLTLFPIGSEENDKMWILRRVAYNYRMSILGWGSVTSLSSIEVKDT
jgi:hypothetical protein